MSAAGWPGDVLDVRTFGATGGGGAIDSPAINRAIAAAAKAGGGTVLLPPGTYASYSVRLQSRVRLYLEAGAVLLAADPPGAATDTDGYDPPEPPIAGAVYQDFGHTHWHNSLIWGENLHQIAIAGPGLIHGKGLVNGDYERHRPPALRHGVGNKAIALKGCTGVALTAFSVLRGGHFGVLATGCRDMAIERLRIDTNRDGINLDCCREVRITDCEVNSPNDDGICLKTTLALGAPVLTEDITIRGCTLRGNHEIGSMLDGTLRPLSPKARVQVYQPTGRIKLGTESNTGFRHITMTDNVFRSCRGVALETVDGGVLEDVAISGLTLYDVRTAPIFIRLGARLRGPAGGVPGTARGISISDVEAEQRVTSMPIVISGIPGHRIDDVRMTNVHLRVKGGGTRKMAKLSPPELPKTYPEPECFGIDLPACGLFARHIAALDLTGFTLECLKPDARPAFWLNDIGRADISLRRVANVTAASLEKSQDVGSLRIEAAETAAA